MDSALVLRRRGPPPVAVALGAVALLVALLASYSLSPSASSPASYAGVASDYGNLPLSFEPNAGRTDRQVDFLSHSLAGGTLYLTGRDAVIAFEDAAVTLRFAGAATDPIPQGLDRLPGEANSFIGDEPSRWRTHVPTYGGVRYSNVYPGIDVDFYGSQRNLEYDFRLAPHAHPSQIAIDFSGADSVRLNANGDLLIAFGERTITQRAPIAYQRVGGGRRAVESAYVLEGSTATLELGSYDRSRPLVIDPTLVYSTYLGGNANDFINAIAVDSSGAAYLSGHTVSTDFPTVGPYQGDQTGGDAFVSKLNPAGTALVYSTYLGGDMSFDEAFGIAVDSAGAAYVAGRTNSTNFPTQDELQTNQPFFDAFAAKLEPSGSALAYSTYLGGAFTDEGFAVAVDSAGSAYVTGMTDSDDFPTEDVYQVNPPSQDVFVTKLDPDSGGQVALAYSTHLGGADFDRGFGIAVDSTGAAYVTGDTDSTDLPTPGGFQGNQPDTDAFVIKLNPDAGAANTLAYSTYLGGDGATDQGRAIAVDSAGAAYVTGQTNSTNFPTLSPIQADQPDDDVFVTKLNPSGSALAYSTYLGGSFKDWGFGIAVDSSGSAHVTGITGSSDFPQQDPFQLDTAGDDIFVTKLSAAGSTLTYSTYLGGNGIDFGRGIALDSAGDAYVAGYTSSTDFPLLATARRSVRFPNDPADSGVVAKLGPQSSSGSCAGLTVEKLASRRKPGLSGELEGTAHAIDIHNQQGLSFEVIVRTTTSCDVVVTETAESVANFGSFSQPFNASSVSHHVVSPSHHFGPYSANNKARAGVLTNTVRVQASTGEVIFASATVTVYSNEADLNKVHGDHIEGLARTYDNAFPKPPVGGNPPGDTIKKVEVGVLSTSGGAQAFAKPECRWLTKQGDFKDVKPGDGDVCDKPVWIKAELDGKAKDNKRDWEYEFKKELEPGKYIAYSRATNKAGVSEPLFTKKIGNLKKFKVKP